MHIIYGRICNVMYTVPDFKILMQESVGKVTLSYWFNSRLVQEKYMHCSLKSLKSFGLFSFVYYCKLQ